jgi:hypothetical protein
MAPQLLPGSQEPTVRGKMVSAIGSRKDLKISYTTS